MSTIIVRTEVHQNPDKLKQWALSFVYDQAGDDGDIIRVGSKTEMDKLNQDIGDLTNKTYTEALGIVNSI